MGFITALSRASLKAKVLRFRPSQGSRGSLPLPPGVAQAQTLRAAIRANNKRIGVLGWIPAFAAMTSSRMDETHGEVERLHVLGERAYRDAIDAGFGDGSHGTQRDAARGLELGTAVGDLHRFAHAFEVEIVEEDELRARVDRLAELLEGLDFDLQHEAGLRLVARGAHRL